MIDRIVEGKRKKLMGIGPNKRKKTNSDTENSKGGQIKEIEIDREALLKEELDKIKSIDENNALIQTFTGLYTVNRLLIHYNFILLIYNWTSAVAGDSLFGEETACF